MIDPTCRWSSEATLFHLQLFDVDARGQPINVVRGHEVYEANSLAVAEGHRQRLGTHFRIVDECGQAVFEDSLIARVEAVGAKLRALGICGEPLPGAAKPASTPSFAAGRNAFGTGSSPRSARVILAAKGRLVNYDPEPSPDRRFI
jgi:hypothetical protein